MKRYFYNCYVISENGSQKFVTITHIVSSSLMPTQEEFIEKLKLDYPHLVGIESNVLLISIQEFSAYDFYNFIK
jgi:hypothetical protein